MLIDILCSDLCMALKIKTKGENIMFQKFVKIFKYAQIFIDKKILNMINSHSIEFSDYQYDCYFNCYDNTS